MRRTAIALAVLALTGASLCFGEFMVGADLSGLTLLEERGARYFDDGKEQDALEIFKAHGYNTIRLRLFLEADGRWGAVNDLPYTLKLAQRVKKHGFKLLLDLHYSDTWADPGHQNKPKAWEDLSYSVLKLKVFDYTRDVVYTFKKNGCMPDYVQIGNEITPGMLWPDGKVGGDNREDSKQWKQFTELLKAGVCGVRAIDRENKTKIVIHIDRGASVKVTDWFFSHINDHGVPYDIIGLSYYPWMHGSMNALRENLEQLGTKYRKDVILAETAHPHRPIRKKEHELEFPETPDGQRDYLETLTKAVLKTPNGHGSGIFYWYPEAVPVKNHNSWLGGAAALFDEKGHALPAIGTIYKASR